MRCIYVVHVYCKEYEVVASTAAAADCGSGGGVAVKHGVVAKGPVVGLLQVALQYTCGELADLLRIKAS